MEEHTTTRATQRVIEWLTFAKANAHVQVKATSQQAVLAILCF